MRQDAIEARQIATDARQETSMDALQDMVGSLAITTDKILVNLDKMIVDSAATRKVMIENTNVTRRTKRENVALRSALALCLAIFVGGTLVVWRDHVEVSCIKRWAVGSGSRANAVTGPSADRVTDLYGALGAASGGALKGVTPLPSKTAQVDFIYSAKSRYPALVAGTKADIAKENAATLSTTYYLIKGLDTNNAYVGVSDANPVPSTPFNCSSF